MKDERTGRILGGLLYAGICIAGFLLLPKTSGVGTWALAALIVPAFFAVLRWAIQLIACLFAGTPPVLLVTKIGLACTSLMIGLLLFEVVLQRIAIEQGAQPAAPVLVTPDELQEREAHVPGAARAKYWHNVLHVYNQDKMRLVGDFGPKRADTFRVMVVGDSFTYGQAVAAEATYCRRLENALSKRYRIEVLNLG